MYSCFCKMVMSVNQLGLYGAVADMIQELPEGQVAPGRPVTSDQTEQEILIQPPRAELPSNDERHGNPLQECEQRFERLNRRPETFQIMLRSRFEFGRRWTILLCSSITERTQRLNLYAENMHYLEKTKRRIVQKGVSVATNDSALSWR